MATTVYEDESVKLFDGTELPLRPLKISILRKFMKKFEKIEEVEDSNVESMDVLVDCVQIAMQQYDPELAKSKVKLEDQLDLPTMYKIIEVASGISLGGASNPTVAGLSGQT